MAEKNCDGCGEDTQIKHLGKIRGESLCRKCRSKRRLKHREETLENSEDKEKIKELDKKIKSEYQRTVYRKKNPIKKITEAPTPKGSIRGKVKQKNKSESYLGFQESQVYLKILMGRGLDFEEAKETIKNIREELKQTREKLRTKNKSEKQIKIRMQEKLEELFNS